MDAMIGMVELGWEAASPTLSLQSLHCSICSLLVNCSLLFELAFQHYVSSTL